MSKLIILVGVPGAGKSTFAAEYVATHPDAAIVGRDKLRELLFGFTESTVVNYYKHEDFKQREVLVTTLQHSIIGTLLQNNMTVIVDDTNCRFDRLAALSDHYTFQKRAVEVKFFDTPLEECLRRNEERARKVPAEVILNFYESFLLCKEQWKGRYDPKPLTEEGFVFLDSANKPYWIALWDGDPWLFYWHPDKRWVSLRRTNQTEIWQSYERRLPDNQAAHYHSLSKREPL